MQKCCCAGASGSRPASRERIGDVAVAPGEQLRQAVERGGGKAEGLADLAHRRARAVAHDVGHHGGVVAAVLRVDVLDHLLAAAVLDVEVDVGRLGPLAGEKALEQQVHPHRVDRRDAEAVADRRVGRRAAALGEDAAAPADLDDVPHRQEVSAVVELVDQRQLPLELRRHVGGNQAAVAAARPAERELPQALRRAHAVGQALGGVAIDDIGEGKGAATGDLAGALEGVGQVVVERGSLGRRGQRITVVRPQARARGLQAHAAADRREHVLQAPAPGGVVEHLGGRRERGPQARRGCSEALLGLGLAGQPVAGDGHVEAVGKGLAQQAPGMRDRVALAPGGSPSAVPGDHRGDHSAISPGACSATSCQPTEDSPLGLRSLPLEMSLQRFAYPGLSWASSTTKEPARKAAAGWPERTSSIVTCEPMMRRTPVSRAATWARAAP